MHEEPLHNPPSSHGGHHKLNQNPRQFASIGIVEEKQMATAEVLKLHGLWASPLCMAVELVLKLKGLEYECLQEDLADKSEAVLRLNPIHRKVPVLVHNGKPLAETLIIFQYIDETWKEPPLLPEDPYERAMVRFWVGFLYSKLAPKSRVVFLSEGEEREKATEELAGLLAEMEEQLNRVSLSSGEGLSLLDIAIGTFCCWLLALEEIAGVALVNEEENPFVLSHLAKLAGFDVAKTVLPGHGRLVEYALSVRERLKASITF